MVQPKAKEKERKILLKTKAFFIKLVMTLAVLFVVLGLFFGVTLGDILIIGIILTIIGFVADFSIMPRIGGVSATAGDLVLAFLVIYVYGLYGFDPDISVFSSAFLTSMFIAAGELYFHKYLIDHHHLLKNEMDKNNKLTPQKNMVPRAEFSEDFDKNLEKKSKES
ncbi:DUF2512 family protein [Ureibacillus sp. NPDC094379]